VVDAELADAARRVLGGPIQASNSPYRCRAGQIDLQIPPTRRENRPKPIAELPRKSETTAIDEAKPFRKKRGQKPVQRSTRRGVIARRLYRSGQSEYRINGRTPGCATFRISSWHRTGPGFLRHHRTRASAGAQLETFGSPRHH